MIFVYRAAIVAVATFVSALAGFGAHSGCPPPMSPNPKAWSVWSSALVASLLSLVLSLLIWTSQGLCNAQQSQLQTIGSSIIRLDFVLKAYGPEAEAGLGLLREHVKRICARLWSNLGERPLIYNAIYHADVPEDVHRMIAFFVSLRLRTKCVLFFGDGLLSDVGALTIVLAALGAICVASAVLLILELSDPYSGLFRMPHEGFDAIIRVLTKGAEMPASPTPSAPTPSSPALWRR